MKMSVLGLGLIGGSLARRLVAAGHDVTGWDTDRSTRALAGEAGLTVSPDGPGTADVVVLAGPLDALPRLVEEIGGRLAANAVLTDTGSVKGPVLAAARGAGLGRRFVGGHPMAGREVAGFAATDPDLFDGVAWVLGLEDDTSMAGWLRLADLYTGIGARVVPATAAEQDTAVARISHLPHVLAAALAVAADGGTPLAATLAAGSYRDGTRVISGPPDLARTMCAANAVPLTVAVEEVRRLLAGDLDGLLLTGHSARARWPPSTVETQLDASDPDLRRRLQALGRAGGWVSRLAAGRLSVQGPA